LVEIGACYLAGNSGPLGELILLTNFTQESRRDYGFLDIAFQMVAQHYKYSVVLEPSKPSHLEKGLHYCLHFGLRYGLLFCIYGQI
jgi:hypothetical protein